jgi:hypothetical protein
MPVTEVLRALGSWELQLSSEIPQSVWGVLQHYGHVAVHAGPIDIRVAGDSALSSARYVGVLRKKSHEEGFVIGGAGMALWLGDEDGKGWVIENPLAIVNKTLEQATRLILPPASSAILEGSYFALPGNPLFTNTFQWVTQREALNYLADTLGAEWKVLGTGHLHIGPVGSLFVTNPTTVIMRRGQGNDLTLHGFLGALATEQSIADFTTRVVLLASDENGSIATADADLSPGLNPYLDVHGASVHLTRLIGESSTDFTNAPARAQLQLNRFSGTTDALTLSTADYDVKGTVQVGDSLWVYDPEHDLVDNTQEIIFRGQRLNPLTLRLTEMTWPIINGMHVAFRDGAGVWTDLTPYVEWETGETTLVVGGFRRGLGDGSDGGGGLTPRPNPVPNTTIPNAPTWVTPFLQGTYQSAVNGDTKAQTQLQWNQPTNTDSTAITDGDYYEIRYRTSTTPLFPVTHAQLAVFTHAQLAANGGTFGQPIQYPVTEWQYTRVPFTELKVILYELTPAMPYEAEIRVVDNGTPANAGDWSVLTQWQSGQDSLAPSTPAAPSVAASLIAVQVTHFLGQASGGTFNLEKDLHHLEVHAAYEPTFAPSDATRLGRLLANANILIAQIPVVGTFQIAQTSPMYFKVIAVDEAGNKSQPSPTAVASATLIDNAHITDLSVSKLTAGTIIASFIHAGWLRIGAGSPGSGAGPAIELTPGSIQTISPSDGLVSRILSTTGQMEIFGSGGIQIKGSGGIQVLGGGNVEITDGAVIIYNASHQKIVELGECADGRHGLQVYKDSGTRVSRIGELESGGHGIEVIDEVTGALVKVSTLAFGTQAGNVAAFETLGNTGGAFTDIAGGTFGPQATVTIGNSGRAIVLISTGINSAGSGSQGAGYVISGATTRAASANRIVGLVSNTTFHPSESFCNAFLETGLNPGSTTFTMKYFSNGSTSFYDRNIMVIPY